MNFVNDPIAEKAQAEVASLASKGVIIEGGAKYNRVFEAFYKLHKQIDLKENAPVPGKEESYWQRRCEAAEDYLNSHLEVYSDSDKYKVWQQLKSASPSTASNEDKFVWTNELVKNYAECYRFSSSRLSIELFKKDKWLSQESVESNYKLAMEEAEPKAVQQAAKEENNGFVYDYEFLFRLTRKANKLEWGEGLSMEEIEAVLLALEYPLAGASSKQSNESLQQVAKECPVCGGNHSISIKEAAENFASSKVTTHDTAWGQLDQIEWEKARNYFLAGASFNSDAVEVHVHGISKQKSDAVEFAEWIGHEDLKLYAEGWCQPGGSNGFHYSTEDLYRLFKQQK